MSSGIVFHLLAALAYAVLAASVWHPLLQNKPHARVGRIRHLCLAGAIVLHGAGLYQAILPDQSLYLGWR